MALTKLTENGYLDAEKISEIQFRPDPDNPILEITYKGHDTLAGFRLFGAEALEGWANFKNHATPGRNP